MMKIKVRNVLVSATLAAGVMVSPLIGCGDGEENNIQNNIQNNVEGTFGSVTVADQTADPANTVTIAEVVSVGAGFIVIHADEAGSPGEVLGQTAVADGTNADVTVELSRDAIDGETLYAMLHVDLGVEGTYEFPGVDVPANEGTGGLIAPSFEVTVAGEAFGSVTVADQTADPANTVTIGEVVSVGAGFIVIHADNAGAPGDVLGQTSVSDGTNTDVSVELSRDAVDGETLYAMLHVDLGTQGTYEFPGADVPATDAAGDVITPSFEVTVAAALFGSVTVADQGAEPANEVTISEVVSVGAGFIVIHADNAGAPGDVLGQTAVTDGTNADVTVELSRVAVEGETLYAMLHVDLGVEGTYEFPGDDIPAVDVAGDVITPGFTVDATFGAVTVADQTANPANTVTIGEVVAAVPSFIVIHQSNGNGSFGAVLGQTAVAPGANADISVALNRSLIDGETLYAMLHVDLGTEGTYEFPGVDGPATDSNGDVIVPTFVATVGGDQFGSVTVADQTADPTNQVTIGEVVSVGPGFLVIHEDDGAGSFGAVLGQTAVGNGSNEGVVVALNRAAVNGETLYAMLHTDAGVIGTYEFPGVDGPATDANAAVITPTFVVTVDP